MSLTQARNQVSLPKRLIIASAFLASIFNGAFIMVAPTQAAHAETSYSQGQTHSASVLGRDHARQHGLGQQRPGERYRHRERRQERRHERHERRHERRQERRHGRY